MKKLAYRDYLTKIAELALEIDEGGYPVLASALLLIVRGARQSAATRVYLVNTGACMLDSVEEAHYDARHPREAV